MVIIKRYIAREFITYFLVCILSLVIIAVLFSTLAELQHLEKENGFAIFLNNVLSGIPLLIEVVAPISVLLATVLAFISLSKSSEIIAMMAAGVSLFHLIMPVLLCGIVISFLLYLNQSYLAPYWGADKRAGLVSAEIVTDVWRFHDKSLYYFTSPEKQNKSIEFGKAYTFKGDYTLDSVTLFNSLRRKQSNWQIESQVQYQYKEDQLRNSKKDNTTRELDTFPVVFTKNLASPKYSNLSDLIGELLIKTRGAVDYQKELFGLYQKISGSVAIFVMILLALPFSVYSGRSANVRTGIVISVVMGFVFWLVDQILVSLNQTGDLPMGLSAFGANIIFLGLAFTLIRLKRA
ncbi:LptF/LptG family permease [bacterium]|nr:LptF/LptG family permease [bacterium]